MTIFGWRSEKTTMVGSSAAVSTVLAFFVAVVFCAASHAQHNAVPFVNQSLVPASSPPGSPTFTLTVTGTGFASTAFVNWNRSPRLTEVISSTELKATITASDVAKAGTAWVTVTNPVPGGGTSDIIFFPIRPTFSAVAMVGSQAFSNVSGAVAGDFNNDDKLDVAWLNGSLNVSLGNGNGTFKSPIVNNEPFHLQQLIPGDFNGDGKLDLLGVGAEFRSGKAVVFLGNGDGTFTQGWTTVFPNDSIPCITAADFNQDGHLDFFVSQNNLASQWFQIYPGNGDGTFTAGQMYSTSYIPNCAAVGDFNRDGKLDLAVSGPANGDADVFLGNGDGTFHELGVTPGTNQFQVIAADMNHDGKLDLIGGDGCILLANGDGTFTSGGCIPYPSSVPLIGDLNGDGNLDLALLQTYYPPPPIGAVLLGAGNGTFSKSFSFSGGTYQTFLLGGSIGDFNNDGLLDLIMPNGFVLMQSAASLSPTSLAFGSQNVGTKSPPQTATFTNVGNSALSITKISIAGTGAANFLQTNNCGISLAAGTSCTINLVFKPAAAGTFSPALKVAYTGVGSPQLVTLSGTGVGLPKVTLRPVSLKFAIQLAGTTSSPQTVTLTNTGTQTVTVSNIAITGAFGETNNCPASLSVGGICQIQVVFQPQAAGSASGKLTVTDSATGSPQTVSILGTGTVMTVSPVGINFGNQKVGTRSATIPVTLTNTGESKVFISGIAITGTNTGDFTQTNNCDSGLAGKSSCTIQVTFKPTATGARSALVSVSDNGGGSPQTVPLAGTGT
jgi:hypothetical protein